MNPFDAIGQNRGADYWRSLENYSMLEWRRHGGKDGGEPYFEDGEELRGMARVSVTRVYVDARLFPTWETWKPEADRAMLGVVRGRNPIDGLTYFAGDGCRLSGDPAYIIERVPAIGTRIWINILCPDASEFARAKADAEQEATKQSEWEKESGLRANALLCQYGRRTTKYCSLLNRRSKIDKQLAEMGIGI